MRHLAATLVTATLFLTGCGGSPSSVSPSSVARSTSSSANPTAPDAPDSTGESTSSDEPAVRAYRRYLAALDTMTASGGRQTKHLSKVATGVALRSALDQAKAYRHLKLHTTGATRILWARTVDVTRASSTQVTVRACYDTTESKPVDAKGRTALKPGAPTRWQDDTHMHLTTTWKATTTKSTPTPC